MSPRKRLFGFATSAVAIALVAAASPAAAAGAHARPATLPSAAGGHRSIQTVDITMSTARDFTAPTKLHAGWITFWVSSADSDSHALEVLRINPGHTLAEALHDLELGLANDLASNAMGARLLPQAATLMGGVVTTPYAPQGATLPLTPGTYYLVDFAEFNLPTPVPVHTLKVVGHMRWSGMPSFDSVIGMYMNAEEMPVFASPTDFSARANILIYGRGDELHEAVFRPVRAGVTDQYITDWYHAIDTGQPLPGESPWTDIQHGFNAMSPGQIAVYHMNLPPGRHALICYVPSDESGVSHAHMGMHQMVTLH
jgi:hypothetical protein